MATMGERIRAERDRRGLTLETVAKAVGISAQALSQWETDVTKGIRPVNFLRWCAYFGVDPYYIVFGTAKEKGPPADPRLKQRL